MSNTERGNFVQWTKHNPRGVALVAFTLPVLSYPVIWDHALGQPDWYWLHLAYLICLGLWVASAVIWTPNTTLEEEFKAHER